MDKKIILLFLLILVVPLIGAEDFEIPDSGLIDKDPVIQQTQDTIKYFGEISQKIDAQTQGISQSLVVLDSNIEVRLSELFTTIIVTVVIINLASMGLAYGIYFYFKSKRLI